MRAIIAIDSFKSSLTSAQAGQAAREALLSCGVADEDICCLPVSDGGEGFCRIVVSNLSGEMVAIRCHDPLGREITAEYGLVNDGRTAVIESASVIGLDLVGPHERKPMLLDSFGLGEMILHAAGRGVEDIYIGLGGTSTCDGGTGMLRALGFSFHDGCDGMRIDLPSSPAVLPHLHCFCDTDASFYGPGGAVYVFGPQKGLTPDELPVREAWMKRLSDAMSAVSGVEMETVAGAGAAGGLGGALCLMLGADMKSGAQGVLEIVGFGNRIHEAADAGRPYDLVITGEGKLDSQTSTGKLPWMVRTMCRRLEAEIDTFRPTLVCLAGKVEDGAGEGFDHAIQITPECCFREDGSVDPAALGSAVAYTNLRDMLTLFLKMHK